MSKDTLYWVPEFEQHPVERIFYKNFGRIGYGKQPI
jgi:hypothetical protein